MAGGLIVIHRCLRRTRGRWRARSRCVSGRGLPWWWRRSIRPCKLASIREGRRSAEPWSGWRGRLPWRRRSRRRTRRSLDSSASPCRWRSWGRPASRRASGGLWANCPKFVNRTWRWWWPRAFTVCFLLCSLILCLLLRDIHLDEVCMLCNLILRNTHTSQLIKKRRVQGASRRRSAS